MAFGAGAGIAGGLTWYAAARTGNPWLILAVVVAVIAAPTAAGAGAAWRTPSRDDPAALRRDRLRQGLAAGALTGGVAALLITILIFGTMVMLHRQSPAPSTEELMSVLFLGPLLGMALGLGGGSLPALRQPKPAPPSPLAPGTSARLINHLTTRHFAVSWETSGAVLSVLACGLLPGLVNSSRLRRMLPAGMSRLRAILTAPGRPE